ncbi:MAG: TIM barrel protein [Phycisphaerae bacterium]|jgi:sugar phosphate isomerase/epimerase
MACEVPNSPPETCATRTPLLFRVEDTSNEGYVKTAHERARASGFSGIELAVRAQPPSSRSDSIGGCKIGAIAASCGTVDPAGAIEEVGALLVRASNWGATCLNLTIPRVAGTPDQPAFTGYQDALNFAYQLLHELRLEAEATGVALALEAAVDRALLSPVELREIIDAANSWAVGVCIDVQRITRIGCPADWIKTLRHRVHAVRLSGAELSHATCSTGEVRLPELERVTDALRQIAYDRPVILADSEVPDVMPPQLTRLGAGPDPSAQIPCQEGP